MLFKNIYLALAGQADESRLIAESIRIVTELGAKLTVIHINDPNAGRGHMMPDTNPKISEEEMKNSFTKSGFGALVNEITFQLFEGKPFATAIAEATGDADLLIMGHHHKNLLKALLLHGTDERVADRIQCPVLLVPAADR